MILNDGMRTEVNRETARYKFGGDPMAEYLYSLSMSMGEDARGGDSDYGLWFARFGRRILFSNDQGFVWVVKCRTIVQARIDFGRYEEDWLDWHDDVTCTECGTHFPSEDGACWNCGTKTWTERER